MSRFVSFFEQTNCFRTEMLKAKLSKKYFSIFLKNTYKATFSMKYCVVPVVAAASPCFHPKKL